MRKVLLRVLGYHSPYPPPGGAGSGYLLEAGEQKILIECGSGVVSRLKPVCDFRRDELDAVIISHLHPDHFCDLLVLRYAHYRNMLERGVSPLPVYVPAEPVPEREVLEHKSLDVTNIKPGDRLKLGEVEFEFFATDHAIVCCGMRIRHQGKTLVYTGDTAWSEDLVEQVRGADVLLAEASFLSRDKGNNIPKHLTAAECGQLATQADIKRLVLTHFWPEYDSADLLKEARSTFAGEILLARENLIVEV